MRRSLLLIAISLFAVAAIQVPFKGSAVEASPAQGIQISPVLVDLNAEKSNEYSLKITVTNVTAGDLVLKQVVNDFRAKDETGNPEVILDAKDVNPATSFSAWVKAAPNIPLKAHESRVVSITVSVPATAEAGGHYGVVRFSGSPPGDENANVSIAASVGVLVLTRVNGTITESLKVKEFFAEKNGNHTGFTENGPLTISERIENDGNVHVKPSGTITVKNMFGKTVLSAPLNDPAKNVLPKSVRKFSQTLKHKWLFGRYTGRLEATYGYGNHSLIGSFSFWVIPYKLILLLLIILIGGFFIGRKLIKKHNEKIIAKALSTKE